MFYAITNGEPGDVAYFTPYLATWTPNAERAATFGSERAACDKAANLSRWYDITVNVRGYDGAYILTAPSTIVATFINGVRQP